jgi:hypothetical protein
MSASLHRINVRVVTWALWAKAATVAAARVRVEVA